MAEKIYTEAEREQFAITPTSYGPRAVDWSDCPLAKEYAPLLAAPPATQPPRATKILPGSQLKSVGQV